MVEKFDVKVELNGEKIIQSPHAKLDYLIGDDFTNLNIISPIYNLKIEIVKYKEEEDKKT